MNSFHATDNPEAYVFELATTLGWSLVNAIADDQAEAAVHVARKISDGPDVALGQARRLL